MREVAAHLLPPTDGFGSTWRLAVQMIRYRGDLDRLVDATARRDAQRPVVELTRELRERASTRSSPPSIGAAGPITDTAIHLRDAARPLGRWRWRSRAAMSCCRS